ncbi:class I SAM-dependent methyltransferase [Pseudomonas sp. F01002]|uniref:class I SAM-dependent methyltransferase n=1 Tax=Pseudomonas TaxID=286 RepID=UPI00106DC705|nr:class I SAM-dependent methyltransferase [Pseudomonas sp. F01002]TFB44558.1 class I SAM-dependent methyltransferase [Pseudomonas sp. F01002]
MQSKRHWENVYTEKASDVVSWYQEHADMSLALIRQTGLSLDAVLIDVGGGASTLIDDLLKAGYRNLTVLDISVSGLDVTRNRLGEHAASVHWLEADVTTAIFPKHKYDLWHDRAVFHFLTESGDRARYLHALDRALKPGGFVVVGTFAEEGPDRCSGLPAQRYNVDHLAAEFGAQFEMLGHASEEHHTPSGAVQKFLYCYFRKRAQEDLGKLKAYQRD